jgi:enoyl-CoA hydratase
MVERTEHDGVAVVRISRPPLNALTPEVLDAARAAVAAPATAVVLAGGGGVFTAGIDIKAAAGWDAAERRTAEAAVNAFARALLDLPVPLVCAVGGHAVGAGVVALCTADRVVCTTAPCKLGLAEVAAGIPYPAVPLVALRERLAPHVLTDLVLSGRNVGPEEALALGIVDELAAPAEVEPRALQAARRLAGLAAFTAVKAQLRGPARRAAALAD